MNYANRSTFTVLGYLLHFYTLVGQRVDLLETVFVDEAIGPTQLVHCPSAGDHDKLKHRKRYDL